MIFVLLENDGVGTGRVLEKEKIAGNENWKRDETDCMERGHRVNWK